MSDVLRLQIESALARAHMALWQAANSAESMSDQGLADDLYQLLTEVGRVNVSLLKGRGRHLTSRRDRAYLLDSARDADAPSA